MDLHRTDRIGVLLAFGFTFIVQTIVTGEQGYLPSWILVPFGLAIGMVMLTGVGYLLLIPRTTVLRTLLIDTRQTKACVPIPS